MSHPFMIVHPFITYRDTHTQVDHCLSITCTIIHSYMYGHSPLSDSTILAIFDDNK